MWWHAGPPTHLGTVVFAAPDPRITELEPTMHDDLSSTSLLTSTHRADHNGHNPTRTGIPLARVVVPTFYEVSTHGLPVSGLLAARREHIILKRILDVVISLIALVMVAPALLAAALAVRLTSAGPVLFVQQRPGRGGQPFPMFKLRTMYLDADQRCSGHVDQNGYRQRLRKARTDPRITPIGRVLRKLSIDELPQLLNVLRGEMSLVGPRPLMTHEYAIYGPRERCGLLAKPGLTCTWQVSGRSNIDYIQKTEMDLSYMQNWTLGLDLRLLLRTIPAVLSRRGAY
jgi:lipopolysaccharide/colanic/teichoic acid biosynthesis glycosyltransferase